MTPRRLAEVRALLANGKASAALAQELSRAVCTDITCSAALSALGRCYMDLAEWEQGVAAFQLACAASPEDSTTKLELAYVLAQVGATVSALKTYDEAVKLAPESWAARFGRAQGRHLLCQIDEALEDYDAALKLAPEASAIRSFKIVAMNYRSSQEDSIHAASVIYGGQVGRNNPRPRVIPNDKIRVGILSSELRVHSVTSFLVPLLERLPADFEIILYSDSFHVDEMTARLKGLVGSLVQVHMLNNELLVERMRKDELAVAIDLGGHFSRNRLPVFADGAAPQQVAYLGYPNTTGLASIQWRLGDTEIDDFEYSQTHWSERLIMLRSGMFAYEVASDAPPPSVGPDNPVFGYFGHMGKISPEAAEVWGTILKAVPGSKMLIKGDGLSDPDIFGYWIKKLGGHIPIDQLELRPKTASRAEHLQMYADVSVSLDTWPYNGTATVCESLTQGVPVVTKVGERHASRVGHALVKGAGLGEFVAVTNEEYVQIAAKTALSKRRIKRSELAGSRWLQHDKVAAEFWSTLRTIHEGGKL